MGLQYVKRIDKKRLKKNQRGNNYKYYVVKKLVMIVDYKNQNGKRISKYITVPKYFLTDGCTGCNDHIREENWLIHDWLYATHKTDDGTYIPKKVVDSVLTTGLRRTLSTMFGGVSWRQSYRRGPQFYLK